LEICDLEIWKCGIQKIQKNKILKIQIRSAQNVGKVWIGRKKSSWPFCGANFPWAGEKKKNKNPQFLPIFLSVIWLPLLVLSPLNKELQG